MRQGTPSASEGRIPETYDFGWKALRFQLDVNDDRAILSLGDSACGPGTRSSRVTVLLDTAFGSPSESFEPERLSLVDRTAALFALAFEMGRWPVRFVRSCEECGAGNSLRVAPDEFRYKESGTYVVQVHDAHLQVPNGWHEAALENGRKLSARDFLLAGSIPDDEEALAAIEEASPSFSASVPYRCSACDEENLFWFDPLAWITDHVHQLLRQIHQLALAYGWTEDQVLNLSRVRRRAYLAFISERQDA